MGHTKNKCFELVRYPNWWIRIKRKAPKIFLQPVTEIKEDSRGTDKTSTLIAGTEQGGKVLNIFAFVSNST